MTTKENTGEVKALYDIIINDAQTGETTTIKAGDVIDAKLYADKIDGWSRRHMLVTEADAALLEKLKASGAAQANYDYNPVVDMRGQAEEAAAAAAAEAAQQAAQAAAQKVVADAQAQQAAADKAAADTAADASKKGK